VKAIIDVTGNNVSVIRVYEKGGVLCDIHVVEEVEVIGDVQKEPERIHGQYQCGREHTG
jgi:hypothetical protein